MQRQGTVGPGTWTLVGLACPSGLPLVFSDTRVESASLLVVPAEAAEAAAGAAQKPRPRHHVSLQELRQAAKVHPQLADMVEDLMGKQKKKRPQSPDGASFVVRDMCCPKPAHDWEPVVARLLHICCQLNM
jgi:hypothetical protein